MQGSREDNIICTEWLQKSFAYHIVFIIIIIIIIRILEIKITIFSNSYLTHVTLL